MFRGTGNSEINVKNMGVGSLLNAEQNWLLIQVSTNTINIVKLDTFTVAGVETTVEDIHHISQEELRSCIANISYCFSDFSFDPQGLKRGFSTKKV